MLQGLVLKDDALGMKPKIRSSGYRGTKLFAIAMSFDPFKNSVISLGL